MASQFDLLTLTTTTVVASLRLYPELKENFRPEFLLDVLIALNPAVSAFWITVFLAVLQIVLSIASRSYAWNDRAWPLIPPVYAVLFALHPVLSYDRRTSGSLDPRLTIMSILICIWGARLTCNAIHRNVYRPGDQDQRWGWVKANFIDNRILFALAYSFCCIYFTFMLAAASAPLYFAWIRRGLDPKLTGLDVIAASGMLASIVLEAIADNQQNEFQKQKRSWNRESKQTVDGIRRERALDSSQRELQDGFCQSGLFAWSRHPNYFGEVMTWWSFYLFSVSSSGRWLNWTISGPLLYNLLFHFSTTLTETICNEKYSAYKTYQASVSRLLPSPFSRRKSESASEKAESTKKHN